MVSNEKISAIVKNIFYDIKAEALVGDLLDNGLKPDDFLAINKGLFKRKYARDIESFNKIKFENGQEVAAIYLNRDGVYDSLPEGLFHDKTESSLNEQSNISEESKKLKEQEKEVRNFFLPFENEIFLQRVKAELEERKILSNFSENLFDDIYPEFWNLDRKLSRKYVSRMVLLLHLIYQIAGNLTLTAKALESILEETVTVKMVANSLNGTQNDKKPAKRAQNNLLGLGSLGVNFVCGEDVPDMGKTIEFTIGPLKNTTVDEYVENGTVSNFLNCFYSYFVPAGLEVKSKVVIAESEHSFELNETGVVPVLGFASVI